MEVTDGKEVTLGQHLRSKVWGSKKTRVIWKWSSDLVRVESDWRRDLRLKGMRKRRGRSKIDV